MKKLALVFIFLFSGLTVLAQKADDVIGKWMNKDKEAHIQIFKKDGKYFGKLVWLKNPNDEQGKPKKDVKNPSESLRNQSLYGLEILKGFVFKDRSWQDGTIYDPKSGKTYSCKMTLDGNNKLNVRGYVGVSLIGRTDVWTRVN